jgi:hypothetical protein
MPEPNQLQPLLNALVEVKCILNKVLSNQDTDGKIVPVIVQPPRAVRGRTYEIPIKTTATLIAAANSKRANILIVNGGAATVYVGFDDTVSVTGSTNPGTALLAQSEMGNDTYVGDIYGIAVAAGVTLSVWEEYLE